MKKIISVLITIILLSCNTVKIEKKGVNSSHLQQRGELTYLDYEDKPYTGFWYAETSGKHVQGYFQNGKRDGVELFFHLTIISLLELV